MERTFLVKIEIPDVSQQAVGVVAEVIEQGLLDVGLDVISAEPWTAPTQETGSGIGDIPGAGEHTQTLPEVTNANHPNV